MAVLPEKPAISAFPGRAKPFASTRRSIMVRARNEQGYPHE
jgi:hypothetical protein